jgi:hypothetical protein
MSTTDRNGNPLNEGDPCHIPGVVKYVYDGIQKQVVVEVVPIPMSGGETYVTVDHRQVVKE